MIADRTASFRTLLLSLAALLAANSFTLAQTAPPISSHSDPAKSSSTPDSKASAAILDSYGKLPLSFEANHGQSDARVKFLSRTGAYSLFLTPDEAVLALSGKGKDKDIGTKEDRNAQATVAGKTANANPGSRPRLDESKPGPVLRMKLRNANPAAKVTGADELTGKTNYFIGNDPAKWRTNVPTYAKVKYQAIYPGIDLVYYGNQRQLEYDFIIAPGANPKRIAFDIRGAKQIRQDARGDLVFNMADATSETTNDSKIRWHKPLVYQEKDGKRQEIAASYTITNGNRVGFQLANYDATKPLYIDPVISPLVYSTYLGGDSEDSAYAIALDSAGNAYVTGITTSTNFPVTPGAVQASLGGNADVFVTKLNPSGSALVYSTYLGGSLADFGQGIAVDATGDAYVAGYTYSSDFPTVRALQSVYGEGTTDAFVAKLNPDGSALIYSTFLGGSGGDSAYGITADNSGNAYVVGSTESANFPITPGAFQTVCNGGTNCATDGDAFVAKINPTGSALVYSTFLGGSGADNGYGIVINNSGNAYVTGGTSSTDFPTSSPFQPANGGGEDAFVAKLNSAGSGLDYSTYVGGVKQDVGLAIALDSAGNFYVAGFTFSDNFPVTHGAFQTICNGGNSCSSYGDAFVTKLNPTGSSLAYSSYLGSPKFDQATAISVDTAGDAYVTGFTDSINHFPTTPGAFQTRQSGTGHATFVSKFNPAGSALIYSTYLAGSKGSDGSGGIGYGIAVNSSDYAYITGYTFSNNFPVTAGAFQTANAGYQNAFVTKMGFPVITTSTLSSSPNPSAYGQPAIFAATVTSSAGTPPNGETVSFEVGKTILGTATLSGGTATFTDSTLAVGTKVVKAVYGGDANFSASTSNTVSQVITKATSTTTLRSSENPSVYEQPITLTATVVPQYSDAPTGDIEFYDGKVAVGMAKLSNGVATLTTAKLTVGTHSITAEYKGSTSFDTSTSAVLSQVVNSPAPLLR